MANIISFSGDSTQWEGSGEISPIMKNFSSFSNWINMVTAEFQDILSRYEASILDDGVIDIMEKKLIIKELDEFFNYLVALRFYLIGKENTYKVENEKYGYNYSISRTDEGWEGEGIFLKNYKLNLQRFGDWYKTELLKKFDNFTSIYRKVVEDGLIDESERAELYKILDHFIFELLIVRYYINKGIWNE